MIYASMSNVIKIRNYRVFCDAMGIEFGPGAEKRRTPAESRTAKQFLLTVNTGRRGVFLNFNANLAVYVERTFMPNLDRRLHSLRAAVPGEVMSESIIDDAEGVRTISWDFVPYSFNQG